jgi:hypothetical protein
MSNYFKLIQPMPTLIFAGVLSVPTGAFIYACLHGLAAQHQGFALMLVVTLAFWAGYVAFLVNRKIYLNTITYVTKDDVGIITNGFNVKQSDIEALTAETIAKWNAACKFTGSAAGVDGIVVEFKNPPVSPDFANYGNLAGYLIGGKAVVGYKDDLKTTAFQHELGHAIYHEWTGTWDLDACHKFMGANGLL